MADAQSTEAMEALFAKLPLEEDAPELLTRRLRITTTDGRTFFAFVRAGRGPLAFAGWDATPEVTASGEVKDPEWRYFVLGAERPGAPLQIISQRGLHGTVSTVDVEERPQEG